VCEDEVALTRCISGGSLSRPDRLQATLREGNSLSFERFTPHGGAFLLLDDLPEGDLISGLLILGRCLADDNCLLFGDDCWRDLCKIAPQVRRETVQAWAAERAGLIEDGARETLRCFSERLPGFAGSSAGYLRANFLCASATLTMEPDRIVVTLSRPPLDLILNTSGWSRGERIWPWLDARPFLLFVGGWREYPQ